jgi:hypothetical protein
MISLVPSNGCDSKRNLLRLPRVAEKDPSKTSTVTFAIAADTRAIIEDQVEKSGMPNTKFVARVMEWFAAQDPKLRMAILTRDGDARMELTRLALLEMAALQPGPESVAATAPVDVSDAVKIIHLMATKIEQIERGRESPKTMPGLAGKRK